jgi:hypothetical protein
MNVGRIFKLQANANQKCCFHIVLMLLVQVLLSIFTKTVLSAQLRVVCRHEKYDIVDVITGIYDVPK